jgi:membrane protein implicated in regulation of membrane protease activity
MAIQANERHRSIPDVFVDLFHQLAGLLRNEGQLARVEISEKLDKLIGAGIMLAAGALLLLPGLVLLLVAFAYFLAERGMSPAASSLISAVVALAIGAALLVVGLNRLKQVRLVPNKTLRQIQQDVPIVKQ